MGFRKRWSYGFFLGCIIPNRYPMISASIRETFNILGAKLYELRGASCCPAPGVFKSFHNPTWEMIAARNLTIAEELGVNIVTGCNGCYSTLRDAWYEFQHNPEKKKTVNEVLSKIGREFKGTHVPKHIVEVLYLDMGKDYISDYIKFKFNNLRCAVHYGCHLVKPSEKRPWNGKCERPRFLDEIVELTGAASIDYTDKYMCCGAGGAVRTAVKEVSADFTREKLINMRDAGVDAIITACPFCHLQFDLGQVEVNNIYQDIIGEPFKIPVIYITQLLGLAMGINPYKLGLIKNPDLEGVTPFISINPFLNIIKNNFVIK
ncbi:MAG: CoB--CoM heterodisulfide reductase subunit B [Promethearchaeota archaeon]